MTTLAGGHEQGTTVSGLACFARLEKELAGQDEEPSELIYFKIYKSRSW